MSTTPNEKPSSGICGSSSAGAQVQAGHREQVPGIPADLTLERYKYILQQIHALNENLYRFLAIYQTLATTLVGAAMTLFVGYRKLGIDAHLARIGVVGFLTMTTVVAAFAMVLIVVGALSWLDYRNEECDLVDQAIHLGFRSRPRVRNLFRWYETYVFGFIFISIVVMWLLGCFVLLPAMT